MNPWAEARDSFARIVGGDLIMNFETWSAVDDYYADLLMPKDEALSSALKRAKAAGLPAINVAPNQGKLLHLLVKMCGAKRVLEIGTLAGYSSIWMGRALPSGGELVTLEFEPKHAAVAKKNIKAANLDKIVKIVVGAAIDSLAKLYSDQVAPFDFIFIDADKVSTADYFAWALKLSRVGSVVVVDNVVRKGEIVDAKSSDESVKGIRRFNKLLSKKSRISATAVQTVGGKGYDGFVIARIDSK